MIAGALAYYQYHSWRNRMSARIRRLRQPKYLSGAIVGGLYLYFYLFQGFGLRHRGGVARPAMPGLSGGPDLTLTLAALIFMTILLLAWIFPHSRTALAFTEAEVSFLFPAPISRKSLLHFKLLKSQISILFSALLITIIRHRWAGGPFIPRMIGFWAGLSVLNLHLLGSSFAVTMLMDRGISTWRRRLFIFGAIAIAAVGFYFWVRHSLPPLPDPEERHGFGWAFRYIGLIFSTGPLSYVLYPFRLVVAPYVASTYAQFFAAIGPALAMIGLHYIWVMRSNVAFEEASVEFSRKIADLRTAARSGQGRALRPPKKAVRAPFVLRPTGQPAIALFWKNLISTGQYVTFRVWLILIPVAVSVGMSLQTQSGRGPGLGMAVMLLVAVLLAISLFSGPHLLRNDLRQDLPVADVLKMFPMRGWQVVLGEVLAPAAVLAALQWLLLLLGAIMCPSQINHAAVPLGMRVCAALSAAAVLPCVDFLALLIPNAAALYFPAWIQLGKDGPRGFETMGQQLILAVGQWLALLLGMIPAGIAFGLFFFAGSYVHWPLLGLMSGAAGAAIVLAVEAALGVKWLGRSFERFDLSGELPQ
ncbi:MAG TPA: putative ABC exporter domain-containing protein [Verrucomicrobiae bacterium]|jgi:hypothetical protein